MLIQHRSALRATEPRRFVPTERWSFSRSFLHCDRERDIPAVRQAVIRGCYARTRLNHLGVDTAAYRLVLVPAAMHEVSPRIGQPADGARRSAGRGQAVVDVVEIVEGRDPLTPHASTLGNLHGHHVLLLIG